MKCLRGQGIYSIRAVREYTRRARVLLKDRSVWAQANYAYHLWLANCVFCTYDEGVR